MSSARDVLFPDDLSDEAATALTDFLFALALACESRYLTQLVRFHRQQQEENGQEQLWQNLPPPSND
jgi:hypothetical protein